MAVPKTLNAENTTAVKLLALVNLFLLFSLIAVGARIYSRRVTRQKFAFSDYAIFLALFFTTALAAGQITACIIGGIGAPVKIATKKHKYTSIEIYKFGWLLWAAANTCVRLSILHFLHTVFHQSKFTRWGSIILGVCSVMFFTGVLIDFAAICRPFSFFWRSDIPGKCGKIQMGLLLAAIFNLLLDFSIITLPMPALFKLKMPLRRKIGLVLIFGIGAVICGITIVRIWSVKHFGTKKAKLDWTHTIFEDAVLSSIEPSLGIMNACLPFFPALSKRITSSRLWTSSSSFLSSWASRTLVNTTKKSENASNVNAPSWPGSTSQERLTNSESKGPMVGFTRLKDDPYTLNSSTTKTTTTANHTPHEMMEMADRTHAMAGGGRRGVSNNNNNNKMEIDVTRRWEISSEQEK